ncbi:MAG: TetR family transcriptional regulator [Actinomycetota bacterium]
MKKSETTRQKISDAALASFRERGYEQTTIRLIADELGISVGNAYYYFPTKNHLVQELYLTVQRQHLERALAAFGTERGLAARLRIGLMTGLDGLQPYHSMASGFLGAAISPASPVSPFGPDSAEPRRLAESVFAEVVSGSSTPLPARLKAELPHLLWLAYMALALYWVYDHSDGQQRSKRLVRNGTALIEKFLPLLRLPFVRGPLDDVLDLVKEAES